MYYVKSIKSSYSPFAYPKDSQLVSINTSRDYDIIVEVEDLEGTSTKIITSFYELIEFYDEQNSHVVGLYRKSPTEFEAEFYDRKEANVMQYLKFKFSRTMQTGTNYCYNFLHYIMSELQNGVVIDEHFSDDVLYIKPTEVRFHSGLEMLKFNFIDKNAFFKKLTKLMVLRKNEPIIKFDSSTVEYCAADAIATYNLLEEVMKC